MSNTNFEIQEVLKIFEKRLANAEEKIIELETTIECMDKYNNSEYEIHLSNNEVGKGKVSIFPNIDVNYGFEDKIHNQNVQVDSKCTNVEKMKINRTVVYHKDELYRIKNMIVNHTKIDKKNKFYNYDSIISTDFDEKPKVSGNLNNKNEVKKLANPTHANKKEEKAHKIVSKSHSDEPIDKNQKKSTSHETIEDINVAKGKCQMSYGLMVECPPGEEPEQNMFKSF